MGVVSLDLFWGSLNNWTVGRPARRDGEAVLASDVMESPSRLHGRGPSRVRGR